MIIARDLAFGYGGALVLDGVDLVARPGQTVGLIGPNGSGKTTLLRHLHAGLRPRSGLVTVDDVAVGEIADAERARRLAVVAQEHDPEIPLSVADMVLLGRSPHRSLFQGYGADDHALAADALERTGALDLADRAFSALSGGEKQRVLVARALAQGADHLLLDEPTNHLDIRFQHTIMTLVAGLDVTTVVVMHDLNLAARYCDRLVLLDGGRVVATGTVDDVLVPAVLEPVYGVTVRRIVELGAVQLVFAPAAGKGGDGELDPP